AGARAGDGHAADRRRARALARLPRHQPIPAVWPLRRRVVYLARRPNTVIGLARRSMEPQLQPAALRRTRQREEARRAILDATEAILLEDGEELLSIRKLALRCGYTAPTIYHYFRDKDGLNDALLEERFSRLLQRIRRVPLAPDPVANI